MKTELHKEIDDFTASENKSDDTYIYSETQGLTSKKVLTVVILGAMLISSLWMYAGFIKKYSDNESSSTTDGSLAHESVEKKWPVSKIQAEQILIDSRLVSMSEQVKVGFETQQRQAVDISKGLNSINDTLKTMNASTTALQENRQALFQQIDAINLSLNTLGKDIHALKPVKRKKVVKQKTRPAKVPPFHIETIDRWGGYNYVSISQAGHVAFLKEGEQQSGWKVTLIDHLKGQVDFKGASGQHYSTSVER